MTPDERLTLIEQRVNGAREALNSLCNTQAAYGELARYQNERLDNLDRCVQNLIDQGRNVEQSLQRMEKQLDQLGL